MVHDALVTMFSLPDEDVLQNLQDDELFCRWLYLLYSRASDTLRAGLCVEHVE